MLKSKPFQILSGNKSLSFGNQFDPDIYHYKKSLALIRASSFVIRDVLDARTIQWGNQDSACRILDCELQNLPKTEKDLVHYLSPSYTYNQNKITEVLSYNGARNISVYHIRGFSGKSRWIEETLERVASEDQETHHIIGVIRDVTEAHQAEMANNLDRRYNRLTACLNDAYFNDVLGHAKTLGQDPLIINIKINNVMSLDRSFSPAATEYMFRVFAKRLKGELSPQDYIAFSHEKHFQIFLPQMHSRTVLAKSKKLTYILGLAMDSPYGRLEPHIVVSILKPDIKPFSASYINETRAEDMAAFAVSRDNIVHNSSHYSESSDNISELKIISALKNEQFTMVYQPICSALDREIIYWEALLRYREADGKFQSAYPYILAAETYGLIDRLDRYALSQVKKLLWKKPEMKVSLNVSMGTISNDKDRWAYLSDLEAMGDICQNIVVELTETMAIENMQLANDFVARLREMGIQLAIDDFGAGYTSFENLMGLQSHIIKIDGSYIRDISKSTHKQNFVRLLAEMSKTLGLKTIAEMIDNESDARMVEGLGVDYLQGYHLGHPQPVM